ncbi:hypothetical protein HPB48_012340 [Haemaphysalis longicornis]|uniref:Protein hedgehog n=1 Tax=Haemaphysalis longicornis TaxID=44386 RepID=A0A9J6G404_HAELO|nr:hypothetical protein HPB48_012340 [Haemaphysalis longicornis]
MKRWPASQWVATYGAKAGVDEDLSAARVSWNTLAVSVMNQWPGVRLRVTEGWDEEGHHAPHSLHYEGRAVDVTTSDRERSKYGMLARLAVEAGFDWVYYESRTHIHCSVKSESYGSARTGGCFHGDALVQSPFWRWTPTAGPQLYSEVIAFLDRQPEADRLFYTIVTDTGRQITLTPGHLLFYAGSVKDSPQPAFAGHEWNQTAPNSTAPTSGGTCRRTGELVVCDWNAYAVCAPVWMSGVYAPLTREGTVIVDGVAASCYAGVQNQALAHWAFAPLRLWRSLAASSEPKPCGLEGVHWYADTLYRLFYRLLPSSYLLN